MAVPHIVDVFFVANTNAANSDFLGVREATGNNDGVNIDKYLATAGLSGTGLPWCGCYVNWSMNSAGIKGVAGPAAALNWRDFGQSLNNPAYGSIGTLQRPGGGHVGFVFGSDAGRPGWVIMLGGISQMQYRIGLFQSQLCDSIIPRVLSLHIYCHQ